ncbi:MAG: FecR domain-containing protein [Alistipes sp.]|nr:FecR domain-containing protein [Alistipes sp.]
MEKQKHETLDPKEEQILWGRIEGVNRKYDKSRRARTFVLSSAAAASVLLAAAMGWWLAEERGRGVDLDYIAIMDAARADTMSGDDIRLLTSDGRQLSIEGKFTDIHYRHDGTIVVNGVALEMGGSDDNGEGGEGGGPNQLITPFGKRSSLTLADGTQMWVNSDTRVLFPSTFAEGGRELFVEGEVFLDVHRDERAPFVVRTRQMDVTVLGTSFNVLATGESGVSEVVLVEGSVEVATGGDSKSGSESGSKQKSTLAPSQLFSYDAATALGTIREVDTTGYVSWREGYYQFHRQPLDVVLARVARFYGARIEWDEGVTALTCSGKLDFMNDLSGTLETLARAAPITLEQHGNTIRVSSSRNGGSDLF